jgi:hypothetical protein
VVSRNGALDPRMMGSLKLVAAALP